MIAYAGLAAQLPGARPRAARQPRARAHRRPAHREVRRRRGRAARADPRTRPARRACAASSTRSRSRPSRKCGADLHARRARGPVIESRCRTSRPIGSLGRAVREPARGARYACASARMLWARSATDRRGPSLPARDRTARSVCLRPRRRSGGLRDRRRRADRASRRALACSTQNKVYRQPRPRRAVPRTSAICGSATRSCRSTRIEAPRCASVASSGHRRGILVAMTRPGRTWVVLQFRTPPSL